MSARPGPAANRQPGEGETPTAPMRLQRFLSIAGIASRREAERLIRDGEVTVNGEPAELGMTVNPAADRVVVDGRRVRQFGPRIYLALHKPREVICTRSDPKGRRTVMDLIGPTPGLVMPVGRLDYHSSGLLLLTNDGDLANRLTRPASEIPKVYHVKAARPIEEEDAARFRHGIPLDGRRTRPAKLRALTGRPGFWYEVVLTEGRNRQVRRMLEALGNRAQKLMRIAIGPVALGKLESGKARELTESEISRLREAAGLTQPRGHQRKPGWALPRSKRIRPAQRTPKREALGKRGRHETRTGAPARGVRSRQKGR